MEKVKKVEQSVGSSRPGDTGKAYFVHTSKRGLVPLSKLSEYAKKENAQGKSKQEKSDASYMTENDLVPLPFNVDGLLFLQENCSYFDACVRQIAKDVAWPGYTLYLRDDTPDETTGEPNEDEVEKKRLKDFLDDPNTQEENVQDIIERLIIDWGSAGWFGLEVSRDDKKGINGLYHVPAHTIRVHRDNDKYCQLRGTKKVWFKRFGVEADIDKDTGKPFGGADPEKRANELVFYKNYYAKSSWYGCPNVLSAVGAIKGLIGIRDYNLAFFENYGVPAAIVTITGAWEEKDIKAVSDFLDVEIKGSNNAHKTLVLNPPTTGTVEWEPLVMEVKEGSFKVYAKSQVTELLVAYRMPPYRIGIAEAGSLGGNIASEATKIYVGSIVNPLKQVINHIFSEKIIKDGLGAKLYEFWLDDLDIRDLSGEMDRMVKMFSVGAMSPNDIREEFGEERIDDPAMDAYYIPAGVAEVGAEPLPKIMARDKALGELRKRLDAILKVE